MHCLIFGFVGVLTCLNFLKCKRICLLIVYNLIVPEGYLSNLTGIFPVCLALGLVKVCDFLDTCRYAVHYLLIVCFIPVEDGDTGMLLLVMGFHPESKARKVCGEGGNPEGEGLQRGVTPGFIIRREQGKVKPAQDVVV